MWGGFHRLRGWGTVHAADQARKWTRPYTSVQWAWVRALGVSPSDRWHEGGAKAKPRRHRKRDVRDAMRQRFGVRGL